MLAAKWRQLCGTRRRPRAAALARGSPQGWGSTGDVPLAPEGETWLCLAEAFVARVGFFLFHAARASLSP